MQSLHACVSTLFLVQRSALHSLAHCGAGLSQAHFCKARSNTSMPFFVEVTQQLTQES
jgi:hypothetical protein